LEEPKMSRNLGPFSFYLDPNEFRGTAEASELARAWMNACEFVSHFSPDRTIARATVIKVMRMIHASSESTPELSAGLADERRRIITMMDRLKNMKDAQGSG
jgi:hypothetical protein